MSQFDRKLITCPRCNGTGKDTVLHLVSLSFDGILHKSDKCSECKGKKLIYESIEAWQERCSILSEQMEKDSESINSENRKLRTLLWINHGCDFAALYGDDGEMQCHRCMIDFKRDSIELMEEKWKKEIIKKYKGDLEKNITEKDCVGRCEINEGHKGKVRLVRVTGFGFDMKFRYCQTAIDIDRKNGFTVEEIPFSEKSINDLITDWVFSFGG